MRVLAIDTAGPVVGLALRVDGQVRVRVERVQRGSETRLVPWALLLCAEAGVPLGALDGVGVARGPGAFTGLRVGLATAAGLALALDVPLWACDALTPRARRALDGQRPLLALLDARKGRLYAASYHRDGTLRAGPGDLPPEQALALTPAPFLATGEGALVARAAIEDAGGEVWPQADHPAVDTLAALAAEGLGRGEGADPAAVAPLYLRDADARLPRKEGTR